MNSERIGLVTTKKKEKFLQEVYKKIKQMKDLRAYIIYIFKMRNGKKNCWFYFLGSKKKHNNNKKKQHLRSMKV